MDEGGIDNREMAGTTPGSVRRSSLAGMFPFLQKQQSMDTAADSSDRQQRRGMGGKIKPGKQHSRSSSGDVSDSLSPGPGDVSSSAAWHEAAGHGSATTPQGWPSNSPAPSTSTGTPSRGLFSKLLSGKKKHKGSHSPTHVAVPSSPPLGSLSLGRSSNSSHSPRSHSEQLPDYTMNVGGYGPSSSSSNGACLPNTPPHHHRHAVDADRAGDEDGGDYDSCYSTPIGSEAMLSPNQDYGGDTLDLRHMVYDAHGDKSPMPMRQDLPEVFTPGFNELLQQAGGRLQPQEPDTPPHAGALEEPAVALLTANQLALAGHMFDAPAMLLDPTAAAAAAAAADTPETAVQADAAAAEAAAPAVADAVDEFALLEQQVIAEVEEEAAVDAFALLEQQVAAEEAEADEFAELERLAAAEAAAEASAGAVAAEGSNGSLGGLQMTEEPSLPASDLSEGAEAGLPALAAEHSGSPDGSRRPSAAGSDDSPVMGLTSAARRAARHSPMSLVRESMPLFLNDPSRAMGSPLALQPGDESLDDQDMQQLSAGSDYRGSSGGSYGGTRLLSHGGAQRVSLGGSGLSGGGSSFQSSLAPVAEASFGSSAGSPVPEGSPSFAHQQSTGSSPMSDGRCASAAAGSPGDMSPLHPRRLSSPGNGLDDAAAGQVTPCSAAGGPNLAMTPGSVYSTPTLAFGAAAQSLDTPQTHASSAIGSAIRGAVAGPLQLSPAMPDSMPEASPTLMLMPGQGFDHTVGLQGADGSTPSLLDARAASPSAVYATRFTATPFRGALAALPLDAALAAPLVDSSPFSLHEGAGMDTVCLADEAQRVAANLAAAAAAGSYSPGQASTPMHILRQAGSPGSAAAEGRAGSPTEELRDLKVVLLTRQLTELQNKNKALEADNARLNQQLEIYEFEKEERNSQDEMEKQARQYAEEQLQVAQGEVSQLMQAKQAQADQMRALREEFMGIQQAAQQQHNAMRAAHEHMAGENAQLREERDKALDQLNMCDMQLTALKSNNNELMMAVEGAQQRCAELEAALAARDRDLAEAGRMQAEFQAKVEKMMGQVIAADTTKEHYRQKAADEAAKVQQMVAQQQQVMAERQQLLADREKYQHLKQKYMHKSAALKEAEAKLAAKESENQELMTMCDQLLQQQEAGKQ